MHKLPGLSFRPDTPLRPRESEKEREVNDGANAKETFQAHFSTHCDMGLLNSYVNDCR